MSDDISCCHACLQWFHPNCIKCSTAGPHCEVLSPEGLVKARDEDEFPHRENESELTLLQQVVLCDEEPGNENN